MRASDSKGSLRSAHGAQFPGPRQSITTIKYAGGLGAANVSATWSQRKLQRSGSSQSLLMASHGSLRMSRSLASFHGGKPAPPKHNNPAVLSALKRKSKFDQVTGWLERQDSAPVLRQELLRNAAVGLSSSRPSTGDTYGSLAGSRQGGGRAATPPAFGAAQAGDGGAARRQELKKSAFVGMASDAMNSRFTDMFKAFQYVDLDRSGTLNNKEIRRALDMWNIPIDDTKLAELIEACDNDGDGQVDYKEFVDVLARDTVAPAALGKRDMQSDEAMGVSAYAALDQQLGHGGVTNAVASINDPGPAPKKAPPAAKAAKPKTPPAEKAVSKTVSNLQDGIDARHSSMRKAFRSLDKDASHKLSLDEILKGMVAMNLGTSPEDVEALIAALDENGDGQIDYGEFTRGMQRLAKHRQNQAVFGTKDSGVVHNFKKGGSLGKQVLLNDNFGSARPDQVGAAPMVLKHDLGVHTDEPASLAELGSYMNKLRDAIEMKYSMLRSAFRAMDEDSSNYLTKDELVSAVQHFSLPIPLSHIHEIFDRVLDKNGDGQISYNEFADILKSYDDKWAKTEAALRQAELSK
jgi:Ca2+-binding EF-hand superfamily protein